MGSVPGCILKSLRRHVVTLHDPPHLYPLAGGDWRGYAFDNNGCRTRTPAFPVPPPGPLPNPIQISPQESGIDHIIVLTMENRSFDHLLGWLPGAAGIPSGLSFTDSGGAAHAPYALSGDYTGCGHSVPDNSYGVPNQTAYDNGKMDGFLRVPGNDIYSIGYYVANDQPFLSAFAQAFATCDHWFAPILAETFPNRMFLWAAQTDRLSNTLSLSGLPTIFDRLSISQCVSPILFRQHSFCGPVGAQVSALVGDI